MVSSAVVDGCPERTVSVAQQHRDTTVGKIVVRQSPIGHGQVKLAVRSEEHTSELQSQSNLVCRLLLEKKKPTDLASSSASSSCRSVLSPLCRHAPTSSGSAFVVSRRHQVSRPQKPARTHPGPFPTHPL